MTCPKYVCQDGSLSVPFEPNQCINYDDTQSTYYIQPCNSTSTLSYCPPPASGSNSYCIPLGPSNAQTAYPGEPCTGDSTCLYGVCMDGICTGNGTATLCSIPEDCDAGLTCRPVGQAFTPRCELPLAVGNKCTEDTDCVNNAGCNNTVCTPYFRQQEGDAVSDCQVSLGNYYWSYFCESVLCYEDHCLTALNSTRDLSTPCTHDLDCSNSHYSQVGVDMTFHTDCQCSMDSSGNAYCGLFPGDPVAARYYLKLQQWLNSTAITQCHVSRRWSLRCAELNWDAQNYAQLAYYGYSYWYYPQLVNVKDCVLQVFWQEYLNFQELVQNEARVVGLGLVLALFIG